MTALRSAIWTRAGRATSLRFVGAVALLFSATGAAAWLGETPVLDLTFHGQWNPALGRLDRWTGRVLDVRLAEDVIPSGPVPPVVPLRRRLLDGVPIEITALAGERPNSFTPIFGLVDAWGNHVLLLGQDADDLVLRPLRKSSAVRLNATDIRFTQALHGKTQGDTLRIELAGAAGLSPCVSLADFSRCAPAPAFGGSWRLFLFPDALPEPVEHLRDALTLSLLALPIGMLFFAVPRGLAATGAVLVVLGPHPWAAHLGLAGPTLFEVSGLVCGLSGGVLLWRAVHRPPRPT